LRDELASLLRIREPGRTEYFQRSAIPSINKWLERYRFSPALAFDSQSDSFWYWPRPATKTGPTVTLNDGEYPILVDESTAAAALVRLFVARRLDMLHLCDYCKTTWHVAPRSIDRFCSAKCRDAWHAKFDNREAIQRRYRVKLKTKTAAEEAAYKKGRK
jgi:hypothetical protein